MLVIWPFVYNAATHFIRLAFGPGLKSITLALCVATRLDQVVDRGECLRKSREREGTFNEKRTKLADKGKKNCVENE